MMISAPATPYTLTGHGVAEPDPNAAPSAGETIRAAFGANNDVVNLFRWADDTAQTRGAGGVLVTDPDPNAWIAATGFQGSRYEAAYGDRFLGVQSEREARITMSRIDREEREQQTLADAGGWGVVAGIGAGVLSPTNLIPVAGWLGTVGRTAGVAARVLASAGSAAIGTALASTIQEATLQATQETRTFEAGDIWGIIGATVIGGVLGAGAGALTRPQTSALGRGIGAIPSTRAEEAAAFDATVAAASSPASAGAAAVADARGTGELAGTMGVANVLNWTDPLIRTQTSESQVTRNVVRDLAETPLTLAENSQGIATSLGGAVETIAKTARGPMELALRSLDDQYRAYAGGTIASIGGRVGLSGSRLSYAGFREAVTDALLAGDVHAITEVQTAARAFRQQFDKLRDEAIAANVPGFKEAVDAAKAAGIDAGYIYRVYDTGAIARNRGRFVDTLTQHFIARQSDLEAQVRRLEAAGEKVPESLRKMYGATPDEIRSAAEEVTDTIMGNSPARMMTPADIVAGPRGPLKERTLQIPTRLLRDFIERDPTVLLKRATQTMATDTALVKKFGSTDLVEQIRQINDDYNARIAAVTGGGKKVEKARQKLDNARKADIRDITAMRDRLRGNYALPSEPDGLIVRAGRVTRNLNYLRLLGGQTVSSLTDPAKIVFTHGLTRTLKTAWTPLVRGLSTVKMAAKEVELAGAAVGLLRDDRLMSLADIMDAGGKASRFERGLSSATGAFGVATLMTPWNGVLKRLAGIITQTRMLQAIERVVKGTASKKEITYLAAGGIDANMAERLFRQFDSVGVRDGEVWWANTSEWTDRQAIDSFRSFLVRDVDRTIVTPGQDKPLWMSTETGKLIGQFKSFAVASIQRTLLSGLQQRDMAALNGTLLMLGLGALTYWAKANLSGQGISEDPAKWATEALDYSGLLGWLMEANNMSESVTGGRVGLSAITGERATRYASRGAIGALLGPTFDFGGDLVQTLRAATTGEWTESDIRAARKLMPFQNLFYIRKLLDAAEVSIAR